MFRYRDFRLADARRYTLEDVAAFAAAQRALNPQHEIVACCVQGYNVSVDAVTTLRAAGSGRVAGKPATHRDQAG